MKKSLLYTLTLFMICGFIQCGNPESSGIVFYDENGNRLVAAPVDLGKMNWDGAQKACDELELNGYSDWRLPTKEELTGLYRSREKIGGFARNNGFACSDYYWSSEEFNINGDVGAWVMSFDSAKIFKFHGKGIELNVRAVRSY